MSTRGNYLPISRFFLLGSACVMFYEAYGTPPYLVGSCLDRADYRDVDVRLILDDADFDRLYPTCPLTPHVDQLWVLHMAAFSEHLTGLSKLPIDFQIQRRTQANKEYSGARHALGFFNFAQPEETA